jgi:hypothetical protein
MYMLFSVMELLYLLLIFWGTFMDLFRNISFYRRLPSAIFCVPSTEILLSQCPEKSTALIWLESNPRIVSHGAIPIVAWMSSVHHAVMLRGAAAARISNERRLHTLEFRTLKLSELPSCFLERGNLSGDSNVRPLLCWT